MWIAQTILGFGIAGFLLSTVVGDVGAQPKPTPRPTRQLPAALASAKAVGVGPVEGEMRNVDFRVDERVVLKISYLRGTLRSTRPNEPPWFDDPTSFEISIDSAVVAVTAASLTAMLNTYVFNYPGTDIKNLEVKIEGSDLVQTGVLDKAINLPFKIKSTISVTPDGRLRLHPTSVKVVGLKVGGLMNFFGLELDNLVKVRAGRGVEVDHDDFIMSPEFLLPPPRIKSRVRSVQVVNGEVVQTLVATTRRTAPALKPEHSARNYMFYRGGVLRFGKLTMSAADLQIVDSDPKDPFEFFLSHINDQIVAGTSRNTRDYGLITTLPDFGDIAPRKPAKTPAPRVVAKAHP